MSLRSPLSQAQGLGSAKSGFRHWWMQRMTSIILAPLAIWLSFSLASLPDLSRPTMIEWLGHPLPAILTLVFLLVCAYHLALGMRVIIEDYIHLHWLKVTGIIAVELGSLALGVIGALAVLKIFLLSGIIG